MGAVRRVELRAQPARVDQLRIRGRSLAPEPVREKTDAFSGVPLDRLFTGIQVDVAVRDSDAWIHRVSYHITLLGKIVFTPIVIT